MKLLHEDRGPDVKNVYISHKCNALTWDHVKIIYDVSRSRLKWQANVLYLCYRMLTTPLTLQANLLHTPNMIGPFKDRCSYAKLRSLLIPIHYTVYIHVKPTSSKPALTGPALGTAFLEAL